MGIAVHLVEGGEVKEELLCCVCRMVLEVPCLTLCDHYCCQQCLTTTVKKKPRCHKCEVVVSPAENNLVPDEIIKAIEKLSVHCVLGCKKVLPMSLLHHHVTKECQLRVITCVNRGCNHQCSVQDLDQHLMECPYQLLQCQVCQAVVTQRDMSAHQAVKRCFEQQIKQERVKSARKLSNELKGHRIAMIQQRHLSDQMERHLVSQHYNQQRVLHRSTSAGPLVSQSIQSRVGSAIVLQRYSRNISVPNATPTSCMSCENHFLSGRRPSARRHSHTKVKSYLIVMQ